MYIGDLLAYVLKRGFNRKFVPSIEQATAVFVPVLRAMPDDASETWWTPSRDGFGTSDVKNMAWHVRTMGFAR